ncbi:MAG: hydroxymethylbilane synthase [Streptomyces sp.]|uniref:hydroxymethylbilane synthase n=1 Tax=Streptomyces sp. TaxID=1931 RepID=UPI003D6B6C06
MTHFPERPLRLGTRGSPMALAQAGHVAARLRELDAGLRIETVPVAAEADTWQGDLSRLGGRKGLFVKAVDEQLANGEVDAVVHCLKDVPGDRPLPAGLIFAAMLPRADVRDVLLVPEGSKVTSLAGLPAGSVLATSSVRRTAQILALRPDLTVVAVRGAVGSRLAKLDGAVDGLTADGLVLARAGLERLGLAGRIRQEFAVNELLPAVGAGVLVLECRRDDTAVGELLARLNHPKTHGEATAERAMLHGLRGHCNSPVAGYCVTGHDGLLSLRGSVFSPDGTQFVRAHLRAAESDDPATLGSRVCADLLRQGARAIIG